LAMRLSQLRDVGSGMMSARPGPAQAGARLTLPSGLAWRLQRSTLAAWAVGVAVLGAACGAVGGSAEEVIGTSHQLEAALRASAPGGDLVTLYFGLVVGLLGTVTVGYTVQALLRMRTEEAGGRLEQLLARTVSRPRWLASHITIAAGGTVGLLAVMGLGG